MPATIQKILKPTKYRAVDTSTSEQIVGEQLLEDPSFAVNVAESTDGNTTTGSHWSVSDADLEITGGKAVWTAYSGTKNRKLRDESTGPFLPVTDRYRVTIVVSDYTSGELNFNSGSYSSGWVIDSAGTFTFDFSPAIGSGNFHITASNNDGDGSEDAVCSVSEVSVYKLESFSNNNHGQIYSGRALEFDGIADRLTGPSSFAHSNEITAAFWITQDDVAAEYRGIIGRGVTSAATTGWSVWWYNGKIKAFVGDGGSSNDAANSDKLESNTWYRVVCTWDFNNKTCKIYLNGVLSDTNIWPLTNYESSHQIVIGDLNGSHQWAGKMSDLQLWDSLWTQSDVTYDYLNPESLALNNGGTSLTESNLKLWYPMQDGHRGQQSYVLDGASTGLGDELIVNGDFSDTTSTDSSVSALAGWDNAGTHSGAGQRVTISNGQATMVNGEGNDIRLQQTILTSGVTYKYSIDIISNDGAGGTGMRFEMGSGTGIATFSTVGTHTGYFTADNTSFRIRRTGACNVTFDNVSIKPVNDNHHATTVFFGDEKITEENNRLFEASTGVDWTSFDSGGTSNTTVSIDSNVANKLQVTTSTEDAIEGCRLVQGNFQSGGGQIVVGRTYRVSVDLQLTTPGSGTGDWTAFTIKLGGTASSEFDITYSEATYTKDITVTDNTGSLQIYNSSSTQTIFTVDNVSIKEVGTATGWTDADQQLDIPQTALQSYNQLAWFDQYDDEVVIADTTNDNDNIFDGGGSISAWIYPYDVGENAYGRIVDKSNGTGGSNGYHIALSSESGSTSNIQFARGHTTTYGKWSFDARYITYGEWQHLVVVYDDGNVSNNPTIYLNGESMTLSETGTPVGSAESDASHALTIGNYSADATRTFAGCITEVSMWNKELSQTEVNELYNDGKALDATIHSASPSTGTDYLKGYWRNNGLATWQDLTSNNNDGTVTCSETLLLPAGVDASRDNQGFLMNSQKDTNSLNLPGSAGYGYVEIPEKTYDVDGTAHTFSFWVNFHSSLMADNSSDDTAIFGGDLNDGYRSIYFNSALTVLKIEGDTNGNSAHVDFSALSYDKWYNFAVVCDGSGNVQMYKDGETLGTMDDGTIGVDLTIKYIGKQKATREMDGMIDDVLIYEGKALSAPEVLRNYNAGKRSHR